MAEYKAPAMFSKQVGPLPVGAWILVVGAGVGFAYWRKKQTPTTTTTADTQGFTDQTAGNPLAALGLLQALNSGGTGQSTVGATDNNSWYQSATRVLLARGNQPSLVDSALRKYMQGMSLSTAENAVVELALQLVGPLPSPPPPPTTTPTSPQHLTSLNDYVPTDFGSLGTNLQHLSNDQLINAANLTFGAFSGASADNAGWAKVVGSQYGTDQPLPYLNEIARRYKAGSLTEQDLAKGPVGSWTSGQPAYRESSQDIVNRLNLLAATGTGPNG